MFNFRTKYSYEDLDQDVRFRSDRSSCNLLQFVVIVLAAFGGALFFLVLWFTYLTVRHQIHQAADNAAVLSLVAGVPGADADVAVAEQEQEQVIINLAKGAVEGKRLNTREGREYLAFLGIPYATPPLGELRFQPPVEEDSWNGTLIAKEFKPRCIQKRSSRSNSTVPLIGSEDCLYLNVFTPKTLNELNSQRQRGNMKLPVMIYIHGGIGGAFGHSERNGAEYLLDEDVILVTHHYRLGVLGNLNTMDRFARGNQGLKDTVMALRWIQNNIEKFDGDPTRVTLFGESYGSMSTTSHLISSMSKGLFQRAICQSGSILMPGLLTQNTLEKARVLGSKLNCITTTTQELVSCLQAVDAETIIRQSQEAPLGESEFTMSVEPEIGSPGGEGDTFLPDFPLNLYLNGSTINTMPVMMGVTSAELLRQSISILSSPELIRLHNQNMIQSLVEELDLGIASSEQEKLAMAIRDFYLGSANISASVERNLTFMFSDRSYTHPVSVSANFQFQANNADKSTRNGGRRSRNVSDVYLYQFNYPVNVSYAQSVYDQYESDGPDDFLGVGHADELQFLFPYEPFPLIPVDHQDFNFSRMLVRIWTSFADTGTPEDGSNGAEWTPITGTKFDGWFRLEAEPRMITNEDGLADRISFWNSFNLTELYI